jgi:cell shape-determining protein MreD
MRIWEEKHVRLALRLLAVFTFAGIAALGKYLHPSWGIPGSSAIMWLSILVAGKAAVRMDGAGTLMGVGMAAWGIPIGLENTFGYNVLLYGITGLLIDLMFRIPHVDINHPIGAAAIGLVAHMAKYCFIIAAAFASTVTKHFVVVGLLNAALLHAAFGIASGLIGWALVYAGKKAARRAS